MTSSVALSEPALEEQRGWTERIAYWLTLVLVFTVPFEDVVQIQGFGTASKLAGIGAAGLWFLRVLSRGRVRTPHLYHWLAVLFVAWNALSLLWTVSTDYTYDEVKTYAQTLVLVFLLWDLMDTPERRRLVLQAYVLGALVSAWSQITNFQSGTGFTSRRFTAGAFHPNALAFIFAIGIPAAAELAMETKRAWLKLFNLAYAPLAFYCILLTASRSGLACGLLGIVYLIYRVLRTRPALGMAVVPGAVLLMIYSLVHAPEKTVERVEETDESALSGRMALWTAGLQLFYDRPLTGVGSGAFEISVNLAKPPHNFAISVLSELGLPGLLLYLALLVVVALTAYRGTQPLFWLTMLAVWFGMAVVHNIEDKKQTWVFFSMAVASQKQAPRPADDDQPLI